MDTIKSALLEDPTYVYVALAFAMIAIAAVWYERRSRGWLLALLAPPLLAAGVYGLAALIETDREQILRAVDEIKRDVEGGRVEALDRWLDGQFGGHFGSKEQAIKTARAEIGRYGIQEVAVMKNLTLDIHAERAHLHMTTVITLRGPDKTPLASQPLIWDVHWVCRGQEWRILRAEQPRIGLELRK